MMTFEGQSVQGIEAIVEKYKVRATRAHEFVVQLLMRAEPSLHRTGEARHRRAREGRGYPTDRRGPDPHCGHRTSAGAMIDKGHNGQS
jgi:hypothetical protein